MLFECRVEPVESQLLPYRGMPVCLLMKDGGRIVGRLTACRKGSVILNGDSDGQAKPAATASRSAAGRRAKRNRVRSRHPKPLPVANVPSAPFGPLSLEPLPWDMERSGPVPLREIESVLIL